MQIYRITLGANVVWSPGIGIAWTTARGHLMLIRRVQRDAPKMSRPCIKALLAAGANADCQAANGQTALMRAAQVADKKCVAALVKGGASVNAVNAKKKKQSALSLACDAMMHGKGLEIDDACECIKLLLEAKADKGKLSVKQLLQLKTVYPLMKATSMTYT